MPKIEASESRVFRVRVPLATAYEVFAKPEVIRDSFVDLERVEILGPETARWVLVEKNEKGVRFQADYTVEYKGNGRDQVTWRTLRGNLDTTGVVKLRELGNGELEIDYTETLAPDLPINKLVVMVFKPIVAREVRRGMSQYLDRVEKLLNERGRQA